MDKTIYNAQITINTSNDDLKRYLNNTIKYLHSVGNEEETIATIQNMLIATKGLNKPLHSSALEVTKGLNSHKYIEALHHHFYSFDDTTNYSNKSLLRRLNYYIHTTSIGKSKIQDFISTIEAMESLGLDTLNTLKVYETLDLISITSIYSEYIATIKDIRDYVIA